MSSPLGRPVWRLAWVIVFGAFTSGLDASLANIGLDTIRTDLHTTLDRVQWVSSGYLVALAVSLPICGWLGRRVGTGRLWLAALAAFTLASGLCAAAPGIGALVALRVVQGLAAGLLIPAGQTILGRAVGPGRLGRVMATLGIVVTVAPAIGPIVGAAVLHSLSWRWLFLINLPIGALGIALGLRYVPRGRGEAVAPLDWLGFACAGAGLPLLVYGFTVWGSEGALSPALVVGVAALAAFGVRSLRREHPLMDLRLYRDRVYATASGAAGFTGAVMFGGGLLFPLYFQILHGDGVVTTGLSLLSLGGGTAAALPLSGRLTDRVGGGAVAVCGNLLLVAVTVPFAFLDASAPSALVQALLVVMGMSIALAAIPPGIAAYKTVSAEQLPDATTQVNIVQRLGGAVGGALFAVILSHGMASGATSAFHRTFWWLTGASALALAWSAALWISSSRARRTTPPSGAATESRPPGDDGAREPTRRRPAGAGQ